MKKKKKKMHFILDRSAFRTHAFAQVYCSKCFPMNLLTPTPRNKEIVLRVAGGMGREGQGRETTLHSCRPVWMTIDH